MTDLLQVIMTVVFGAQNWLCGLFFCIDKRSFVHEIWKGDFYREGTKLFSLVLHIGEQACFKRWFDNSIDDCTIPDRLRTK